jgi:hypothetical protein
LRLNSAAQPSRSIERGRNPRASSVRFLGFALLNPAYGLVPGAPYTLVSRQPFNGPTRLVIADRGEQVIGSELAAAIWVTRNQ